LRSCFALGAFAVIWTDGLRGLGRAFAAMGIAIALLGYPSYLAYRATSCPGSNDITTDPIDPPRYEALAGCDRAKPIRSPMRGSMPPSRQRAAYPNIEPLDEDATPEVGLQGRARRHHKRKWIIIDRRPPQPTRREGHIEAVARSLIMGLRDDIVVRVRGGNDGSHIDIRSSSRFGSFDFGSNAERIRRLVDDIDDAIGNEKPEPAVLPVKKPPAVQPKSNEPKRDQPTATTKR